jgi:hypothetical protein
MSASLSLLSSRRVGPPAANRLIGLEVRRGGAGRPARRARVPTDPAQPKKSWTLLGFDVANFPFSGLSSCGYTPPDTDRLRERRAQELNEHHLFRDPESAFAFLETTNRRVPQYAPFHAYSLYRLT